ncbi:MULTISPECIES: heavy metal translocating P-type ATPase [unclassified Microbacterium]|uniref:heavy metal translocating P-type ATPase n=1 Tax=unclassified Microbacterium TaxID=2609290 RepID=UPI00214ADA96|nr:MULTISPECIES: heavy metal translocating P-type ATPase [unclassified Microbacterium]MCR2809567.1 heavy metal translocating P-type ATPase [Microbacterium sp. zg.B185]WIM20870.1 heavy metal translocating P-type ATPase [Microbacterium sp. zg-B185]
MARYPVITATVVVGIAVLVLDLSDRQSASRWLATLYVAAVIVWTLIGMVRDVLRGHVGLDVLAVVAMVATLAVGEYVAALIIVLMLSGGEALEDYAGRRAKRELTALLDRSPQIAHVIVHPGDHTSDEVTDAAADDVRVGDVLLIRPSEIVPVDALLLTDSGSFDESSLTGESLPVTRHAGDEVLSGAVNGSQAVRVRAVRRSADSQYQQIVALVRDAEESRAPVVRLADRFAVPFTAVSLVIAGAAWGISGDPTRFAEVLVLATPCPLLIAAPVAFLGGLSRAAKAGIIVKGGAVIEQLARVQSAAFDKTGTLTQGRPELVEVRAVDGIDPDVLLGLAASAEQYSSHVLADGIRRAAAERGVPVQSASQAGEVATNGVTATIGGRVVVVGKPAYIAALAPETSRMALAAGQAAAYVAIDGRFAGVLVLADDPRPESRAVVAWLRAHGVERIAMLTGDAQATAEAIAHEVGITEVHAELLPPEKVHLAAQMRPRPVLMVGDGVNDAPVLAAADIGIAMGAKGATAAGDAAAAVILKDSLAKVVDAVSIGRHTLRVAYTAIWIGILLSVGLMLVATTGVIPAVVGALVQELVDLTTILYALRALGGPSSDFDEPEADASAQAVDVGLPDHDRA